VEGRAERSDLPQEVRSALSFLAEAIVDVVRGPLNQASTVDEYVQLVQSSWPTYSNLMTAMVTLLSSVSSEEKTLDIADRGQQTLLTAIREPVIQLVGEAGFCEVEFAAQTFRRAVRLTGKLAKKHVAAELQERDRAFAAQFSNWASVYAYATGAVTLIAQGARPTAAVIAQVFEFLRQGSLSSYTCAREAFDLREHGLQADDALPLPLLALDDEDRDLLRAPDAPADEDSFASR
jgi:hypothetical protein